MPGSDVEVKVQREETIGSEFDDEIFTNSKECMKYTQKQKWMQRREFVAARVSGEQRTC